MTLLHMGRAVPKELLAAGYTEQSAMHLGKGCWILRLAKTGSPSTKTPQQKWREKNKAKLAAYMKVWRAKQKMKRVAEASHK